MACLGMIMRSEQEMLALIVDTAKDDERIRAAILNGSRANPNAKRDVFQDYDVVYIVADPSSFKKDPDWIQRFGDLMILQMPDEMHDPPPGDSERFAYLMQFTDGNRIDLTIYPIAKLDELETDSLSLLLLDKDGIVGPLAPPSEKDYLPRPPTAKAFSNCCNEFWWVSPYVAKALWREEITYAQYCADGVRGELMKMLAWHIGINTRFARNLGKQGKYFRKYLEPELWELLQKTYSDAAYGHAWDALFTMGNLFRRVALSVAKHFNFEYPLGDDQRVSAYLEYIRVLPKNARDMD